MATIQMTREKKIDQMLLMMELYFDQEKDEQVLKLYNKLWADVPVEHLGIACREYMSQGKNKYFPKAGDILDIVRRLGKPTQSIEAQAQQQWRLVVTAIRQRGLSRGAPVFDDPITNTLVRTQFTWESLCSVEADKLNWEEKRFVEAYNLASEIEPEKLLIEASTEEVKALVSNIGNIDNLIKIPKRNVVLSQSERKSPFEKATSN